MDMSLILPNPLNPKRYLIVIGMNQWKAVKGWKLHLSRNGVYDFFVFDLRAAPKVVGAGYFDDVWP